MKRNRSSLSKKLHSSLGRLARTGAAAVLIACAATTAQAACEHNGVYYEHGAVLCFGGWLQECTVADYWSAVGMCHSGALTEEQLPGAELAAASAGLRARLDGNHQLAASCLSQPVVQTVKPAV